MLTVLDLQSTGGCRHFVIGRLGVRLKEMFRFRQRVGSWTPASPLTSVDAPYSPWMDLVVRTPHGDADLTVVSCADDATLADLVEAVTGQAAPPLVHIDDRPIDSSTPLV